MFPTVGMQMPSSGQRNLRTKPGKSAQPTGLLDRVDDLAEDVGDREVTRREHAGDPASPKRPGIGLRNDPADHHGYVEQPTLPQPLDNERDDRQVRSGQDGEPDDVD